ncbi:MAG TPA: tRNA pseudouridine(13) synthase TruD, partial [Thermoplasmatales archaeon]|nr:tRNA pseudouridine(13) synthase TruD [Thermoplasmatales archaeon]
SGNIEKVNYAIGRGKAAVTGAVVGYDAMFVKGVMGEIDHAVIEDEKIDVREFTIPDLPFLSSSGGRRTLLAPFTGFKWVCRVDDLNAGKLAVYLSFTLKKGCYATSLLREFMKADKITAY